MFIITKCVKGQGCKGNRYRWGILLTVLVLSGCGHFSDYVGQPMIIDASGRNGGYSQDGQGNPPGGEPGRQGYQKNNYERAGAGPVYIQRSGQPEVIYNQGRGQQYAGDPTSQQDQASGYNRYQGQSGYGPTSGRNVAVNPQGYPERYPGNNPGTRDNRREYMDSSQRQREAVGAANGYKRSYPGSAPTEITPLVTNVRVSEIPTAAQGNELRERENMSMGAGPGPETGRAQATRGNMAPVGGDNRAQIPNDASLAGTNTNESPPTAGRELPVVKVPAGRVLAPADLTQPTVAIQPPRGNYPANGMEGTIAWLEDMVRQQPADINARLALHYLYRQQGDQVKAEKFLYGGEVEDANRTLEVLNQLRHKIAVQADMIIPQAQICSKVNGFGQYEVLSEEELTSGRPRQVQIYCELDNFECKRNDKGLYLSETRVEIVLSREEDYEVIAKRTADVSDTPSQSKRRDFFLGVPMNFPTLRAGHYRLTVKMEDKIARKIARPKHIYFEVKGKY